jgi:hypothetical protein
MAVSETRTVRGRVQLTFFSAISGDADENRRFGSWGERGYKKEAEKQGKMHSHFIVKRGLSGRKQPGRATLVKKGYPINNRKCLGLWMQAASGCHMEIVKILLRNRLSGPQNAL